MVEVTKLYSQYFEVAIFLHDKKLAELLASYIAYKNVTVVLDVHGSYKSDPENEKLILDNLGRDIEKNLSFPLKRLIYNILRRILCKPQK